MPLASTTAQTLPLDAGKIFISAKKLNRVIKSPESRKTFTNDFFLIKVPDDHLINATVKFNALHRKPFIEGIQQLHYTLTNSLKRRFIVDSINMTGQTLKQVSAVYLLYLSV